NSLNRLIRCVCGKKIGPDPRNFNQRVSLGRNDLLIRTFLRPLTVFYLLPYPLPHAFSLPLLFPYGTAGVYFFSHYSASKILIK
ncbi:hypothetical protein L0F22_13105, partial [Klebsiella pneumoniae]|nr:hypothetical protein [Klebsiella pneumoniae]